ncbi:hypothetical protein MHH56_02550 [Paenibacillus sp. FSL K6-3182]|uniref:hypothetical protein n=1 Tax=Paenibacillus sp. FSL K6-3182 TaxID=2921495 RepID=UPI0030CCBBA3
MSFKTKVFTLLICLMPILHAYATPIPNVTLGEIGLLFLLPIGIIDYFRLNDKLRITPYFLFIFVMTITSLVTMILQSSYDYMAVAKLFGRLYFYFCIICILGKVYFNFPYAIKIYKILCIFVSLYLVTQTICYYAFQLILPATVEGIPLYNNETYYAIDFQAVYARLFRPQSIFLEPGVFAQYLLPCLLLCLFKVNKFENNVNIKLALFISGSLILSLSAQAIILTAIIWVIWFGISLKKMNATKKIILFYMGTLGVCLFFVAVTLIEPLREAIIGRFIEGTSYDSTNVRIVRGFQVYEQLGLIFQFVGVGFGNITTFVITHGITTENDLYGSNINGVIQHNYEYMNAIAYVLVTGGFISFLFFFNLFYSLFKVSRGFSRMCVVILLLLSLVGGTLISTTWIVFMLFIYKGIENYEVKDLHKVRK